MIAEIQQKQEHTPFDQEKPKSKCCKSQVKKCCSSTNQESPNKNCCSSKATANINKESDPACCSKETKQEEDGCKKGCCSKKQEETENKTSGCCDSKNNECNKVQEEGLKTDDCCAGGTCTKDVQIDMKKEDQVKVLSEEDFKKWVRIALGLSIFTIVWNIAEGVISLAFGFEEETIALSIFGIDSLIEVASGFVVLWRFRQEFASTLNPKKYEENKKKNVSILDVNNESNIRKERITTRIIGGFLFLLGACAIAGAVINLVNSKGPDSSLPGLLISGISISFMFFLYYFKLKAADLLNKNKTLLADAKCSLSCICLSLVLFIGSLTAIITEEYLDEDDFNGWWIDSVITIIMAVLVIKEGVEAFVYSFSKNFQGGCPCCRVE